MTTTEKAIGYFGALVFYGPYENHDEVTGPIRKTRKEAQDDAENLLAEFDPVADRAKVNKFVKADVFTEIID